MVKASLRLQTTLLTECPDLCRLFMSEHALISVSANASVFTIRRRIHASRSHAARGTSWYVYILSVTVSEFIDEALVLTDPFALLQNVDSGACECPTSRGYLLSGSNADICIKTSACSTKTNSIVGNLCVPKVCAAGQVLLGSATEKSLVRSCVMIKHDLCTELQPLSACPRWTLH